MTTLFSILALISAAFPSALLWTNKLQLEPNKDKENCEQDIKAVKTNKLMIKIMITLSAVFSALAIVF